MAKFKLTESKINLSDFCLSHSVNVPDFRPNPGKRLENIVEIQISERKIFSIFYSSVILLKCINIVMSRKLDNFRTTLFVVICKSELK